MKNKVELKKTIILSFVIFLLLDVAFFIVNYMQYKRYTGVFNEKIDNIISSLKEKYPNLDTNDIVDILNSSESYKTDILKRLWN